ncbi:hypothetical protein VTN96DRAFT_10184 [Rasamsonia emersonii]
MTIPYGPLRTSGNEMGGREEPQKGGQQAAYRVAGSGRPDRYYLRVCGGPRAASARRINLFTLNLRASGKVQAHEPGNQAPVSPSSQTWRSQRDQSRALKQD